MTAPHRVVSLSPNVSMMLFALGADEIVVGRTAHCLPAIRQYVTVWRIPEDAVARRVQHWQSIPVVGVWPFAEAEPIKALQPDLILTSGSGPFGVHEAQTLGVADGALLHFDTRTFADLDQHLTQIGARLGKVAEAAALIEQLAVKRDAATARLSEWPSAPTVLFEYCVCTTYDPEPDRRVADPARTILVGGHLAPDLIQLVSGRPLFAQPGDPAKWVTIDEIREAQPDMVLQYDCHGCPIAQKHPIPARQGWSDLPAVSRHAVYSLRENISDPNLCFPAPLAELVDIMNLCHMSAINPANHQGNSGAQSSPGAF
jgi:ABC-type Fe3+-hydroxamate transport system substrate-binding protein